MQQARIRIAILDALYMRTRRNLPSTPQLLALRIGTSSQLAESALRWLQSRGLVDAARCTLTLKGLALAHAHHRSARPSQGDASAFIAA